MEISATEQVIRVTNITLQGRLDAYNAPQLRKQFDYYLENGAINFVINLAAVEFIDSAIMGVLVTLLKRARLKDGNVRVVWSQHQPVQHIFRLTRLDKVFDMVDTPYETWPQVH